MKRLLTLIAAAALVLSGTVAMASVSNSGHDFSAGSSGYGLCQVCHVPHAAGTGARLWRETLVMPVKDGTWGKSTIGMLCGTCHNSGTWTAQNRYGVAPNQQANLAYNMANHQRDTAVLTGSIHDAFDAAQTKPYTTGTKIEGSLMECTSCHNPHDTTVRPFLRPGVTAAATISGVCADCHNRYNAAVTVVGTPNSGNAMSWNGATVSMHPVNIAYTNDANNGNTTFRATPDALLTTPVADAHAWSLGGKFQSSAGAPLTTSTVGATDQIGCQTCHSVHRASVTNGGTESALHLLAIDNVAGTRAALCEGCHGGPGNSTNVGAGADHPIDRTITPTVTIDLWYNSAGADGVTNPRYERHATNAADWPRGGLPAHLTNGGGIVCVSCHSAHAGRPSDFLKRRLGPQADAGDFCLSCHSDASPIAHHSNTANWPGATGSGVRCTDCHGAAGAGAHNGFGYTRNGPWNGVASNVNSELCEMCHLLGGAKTQDPLISPTEYNSSLTSQTQYPNGYLGGPSTGGHTNYQTHYLGTFTDRANSINAKRSAWSGVGFSKYGGSETHGLATDGTGTNLICESCHSVLANIGRPGATAITASASSGYMNNLLLQDYKDDGIPVVGGGNSTNGGNATTAAFCTGCHNRNGEGDPAGAVGNNIFTNDSSAPAHMHPMTGWSITKAQDAGRAPSSLITTPITGTNASYANNASRTVVYPSDNNMDCDSCHRPHKADVNGTWQPAYKGSAVSVILEKAGPTAGKYDALCSDCHAY